MYYIDLGLVLFAGTPDDESQFVLQDNMDPRALGRLEGMLIPIDPRRRCGANKLTENDYCSDYCSTATC